MMEKLDLIIELEIMDYMGKGLILQKMQATLVEDTHILLKMDQKF
jgi:hypothetical protein